MQHATYIFDDTIIIRINKKEKALLQQEAYSKNRKLSQHIRDILIKK